jgi:hypothetical protein
MKRVTKQYILSGKEFTRETAIVNNYKYVPPAKDETWSNGTLQTKVGDKWVFHACVNEITETRISVYSQILLEVVNVELPLIALKRVIEKEVVSA